MRTAPLEDFTADRRGRENRCGATGSGVSATLGQLSGNSRATLRQLCGKGRRLYFVDMEHAAGIGHGREPAVRGDFVGFAGLGRPGHSTQVARPLSSDDKPFPTELMCRISPDLLEREPIRSRATATRDDQHESDERVEVETRLCASNLLQHHPHLQRAAHQCSYRVRCSFEEDRRVHTCGPEPTGALL